MGVPDAVMADGVPYISASTHSPSMRDDPYRKGGPAYDTDWISGLLIKIPATKGADMS
jgi:hypothetical protein